MTWAAQHRVQCAQLKSSMGKRANGVGETLGWNSWSDVSSNAKGEVGDTRVSCVSVSPPPRPLRLPSVSACS